MCHREGTTEVPGDQEMREEEPLKDLADPAATVGTVEHLLAWANNPEASTGTEAMETTDSCKATAEGSE